ncbi:MAG: hypothetical protein ACT4PU_12005 [Planctomycetota bacterium]
MAVALGCGLIALLLQLALDRTPDLRPVMPEVDGVHPARALQALSETYAPGAGFLDKYPPLGSFLMGLAANTAAPQLSVAMAGIADRSPAERRELLWQHRDGLARALSAQRWLSRVAMAVAVAALALLGALAAQTLGRTGSSVLVSGALAALGFAVTDGALHYGGTTNVDALALAASLLAVLAAARSRDLLAAVALAAAVAIKDPYFVLGPVVLLAALRQGWWRMLQSVLVGCLAYALLSGAFTGPAVWWRHVQYLTSGGVEGVGRIDPGSFRDWLQLTGHVGWLLRGSLGTLVLLLGAGGILWLQQRNRALGSLVLLAAVVPIACFVAPVGFAYLRFLLLPIAMLTLGCALVLASLRRPPLLVAAVLLLGFLASREGALGLWRLRSAAPDARSLVPALLDEHVPDGERLTLFSEEREHGPPLDPGRWQLDVRGLAEAPPALLAWQSAPRDERPEHLLWLSFHNVAPSGQPTPLAQLSRPGDRLGGLYEVIAVLGEPSGEFIERVVAVRPTITLLRRL